MIFKSNYRLRISQWVASALLVFLLLGCSGERNPNAFTAQVGNRDFTAAATEVGMKAPVLPAGGPVVWVWTPDGFAPAGQTLVDAWGSLAGRTEYLPLGHIQADGGLYKLRLSNESGESQYIDQARLIVVDRPCICEAWVSPKGKFITAYTRHAPHYAAGNEGFSVLEAIRAADDQFYDFNDPETERNVLELEFPVNDDGEEFHLLLRLRGGKGLDLPARPGSTEPYATQKPQHDLFVYLQEGANWRLIGQLPPYGSKFTREVAIPAPLSADRPESIRVRLETGFRHWEVDYVSADYSEEIPIYSVELPPSAAPGPNQGDYADSLRANDSQYLVQNKKGHTTELWFPALPMRPGHERSFFLQVNGYVEQEVEVLYW